jgi:diguanylate cyclase (GGDEF)-like protein
MLESGHAVVGPLDPDLDGALHQATGDRRLTHAAAIPFESASGLLGVLCVGFSNSRSAEASATLWVAESYGRLVALCLDDPNIIDELLLGVHRDGLTGCLNYEGVHRELIAEIKRSERHGLAVACCFLDLDAFKAINDRLGHQYGNGVLAGVGTTLLRSVRSFDTVGRYGGDEFLLILPETTEAQAVALAERLRSAVSCMVLASGEPVEASFGVAQWSPGTSAELLVAEADRALIAAKRTGSGVATASELRAEVVPQPPIEQLG